MNTKKTMNNNTTRSTMQTTMWNFSATTSSANTTLQSLPFHQNHSEQQQKQNLERDLIRYHIQDIGEDIEETIIEILVDSYSDSSINGSLTNESSANGSTKPLTSCQVPMFRVMLYVLPIIIVIGLMGNALSLNILTTRVLKCHSARIYLKALAILDSCVLLITFIDWLTAFG